MSLRDFIGLAAVLIVISGGLILWISVVRGNEKPERLVKWRCRRCGQDVNMKTFRCGCAQSPSPWEEVES